MTDATTTPESRTPAANPQRKSRRDQAEAAASWWRALQPQKFAASMSPGDRATLARLRRSDNPFELAVEPATVALFVRLGFDRMAARDRELATAAVLAGVLAHIRTPAGGTLARAMGAKTGDRARVSAIRMKRFMSAREPEDVLRQYRRILAMLDDTANVSDVAECVLAWLDPSPSGDRARTRFAFAYHGATLGDADDMDSAHPTAIANSDKG